MGGVTDVGGAGGRMIGGVGADQPWKGPAAPANSIVVLAENIGSGSFPITLTQDVPMSRVNEAVFLFVQGLSVQYDGVAAPPTSLHHNGAVENPCFIVDGEPCYTEWKAPTLYPSQGIPEQGWFALGLPGRGLKAGTIISAVGGTGTHTGIVRVLKGPRGIFGASSAHTGVLGYVGTFVNPATIPPNSNGSGTHVQLSSEGFFHAYTLCHGITVGHGDLVALCGHCNVDATSVLYADPEPPGWNGWNSLDGEWVQSGVGLGHDGFNAGQNPPADYNFNWIAAFGYKVAGVGVSVNFGCDWAEPPQLCQGPPPACPPYPTKWSTQALSGFPLRFGAGHACCDRAIIVGDHFRGARS